jgi:hypothetical protein
VAVAKGGRVDGAATKHLVEEVEQRFDLAGGRVVAGKQVAGKAGASLEVLVAP